MQHTQGGSASDPSNRCPSTGAGGQIFTRAEWKQKS